MYILLLASVITFEALALDDVAKKISQAGSKITLFASSHKRSFRNRRPREKGPELQENLKCGKYIRLTDNSLWKIAPEDTPITHGWITAVEIEIEESDNKEYPYTLTNSLTKSQVKAKKVNTTNE